jgi:hypothetical protein
MFICVVLTCLLLVSLGVCHFCDAVQTDKTTLYFAQSVIPFCLYVPVVNAIDVLADISFNEANICYIPQGENRRGI